MKNGIVLSMKYSADDEMKKNDYVFNDLIKNKFYFKCKNILKQYM